MGVFSVKFCKNWLKNFIFLLLFFKVIDIKEFRLSNESFFFVDEEFFFSKVYFFVFIIGLFYNWKCFFVGVKIIRYKVFNKFYFL